MSRIPAAVRVANRAINTLLNVQADESVLVIADHASMQENEEIVHAMLGLSLEKGAIPTLVTIKDVEQGVEEIPRAAKRAMETTDVLIGITKTTAASVIHHELPERLRADGELRGLIMVKRSFEALTSDTVLKVDYDAMSETANRVKRIIESGNQISVTSDLGTDFSASIEGMPSHRSDFASEPGDISIISWGEVYQAPTVGSTDGVAVIDGPILEYGWPSSPISLEMEDGAVTSISGDDEMVPELRTLINEHENADNIGELSFGINPNANMREPNIWKKGSGRAHIAIGSGLNYGQSVDSPVHIDLVMNTVTVDVDGKTIIEDGDFVV